MTVLYFLVTRRLAMKDSGIGSNTIVDDMSIIRVGNSLGQVRKGMQLRSVSDCILKGERT
jgi:hypothetical protein